MPKITRDRSDRKAIEDAQDAFYAAFNHDFRTPMQAVKGFADILRDAPEEQREELIRRIEANVDRLVQMLEGLVDFAQRRANHSSILLDDIDVAHVARDAVKQLAPALNPERVVFPGTAVALARANGVALQRVVTNLVVNALKYSPPGSEVQMMVRQPTREVVELVVADSGRGIHSEDLGIIFDELQRGRLSQDDGGTGLGLASVKRLVEEQGGEVAIESELGVGTRVTVRLRTGWKPLA